MDKQYDELGKQIGAAIRLTTSCNIAVTVVLEALLKQPWINSKKLTEDINKSLLVHQIENEDIQEGRFSPSSTEYLIARDMLRQVLPDLPN